MKLIEFFTVRVTSYNLPNLRHLSSRQQHGVFGTQHPRQNLQFPPSVKPNDFYKALTLFIYIKTSSIPEDPFNEVVFEGSLDLSRLTRVDVPKINSSPYLVHRLVAASHLGPQRLINQNEISEEDLSQGLSRDDLISYFQTLGIHSIHGISLEQLFVEISSKNLWYRFN